MADNKDIDLQDNQEEQENKDGSTKTDTSTEDVKTESDNVDTDKQNDKEGEDKKDDTSNVDDTNEDTDNKTVPYSRFKEVNDKYKAAQKELDKLKNNQSNNTDESTDNAELEQYKTAFNELLQSKLEKVPGDYRDLIPNGDDLSKFKWIESAMTKGLFDKKIQSFGNKGNNPTPADDVTKEQFMKMTYRERVKLQNENADLYSKLIKK